MAGIKCFRGRSPQRLKYRERVEELQVCLYSIISRKLSACFGTFECLSSSSSLDKYIDRIIIVCPFLERAGSAPWARVCVQMNVDNDIEKSTRNDSGGWLLPEIGARDGWRTDGRRVEGGCQK